MRLVSLAKLALNLEATAPTPKIVVQDTVSMTLAKSVSTKQVILGTAFLTELILVAQGLSVDVPLDLDCESVPHPVVFALLLLEQIFVGNLGVEGHG
jgi:hypothetical protein